MSSVLVCSKYGKSKRTLLGTSESFARICPSYHGEIHGLIVRGPIYYSSEIDANGKKHNYMIIEKGCYVSPSEM